MKKIRYALEAIVLYAVFYFFKVLPPATASNIGGWIGRTLGPRLAANRKALRNIHRALPNMTDQQRAQAIRGMWDNLGRIMAEYPHLETLAKHHTTIKGIETLKQHAPTGTAAIIIGAHFGNWEIPSIAAHLQTHIKTHITYRAPNNRWSDRLLARARSLKGQIPAYNKSPEGGRAMLKAVKAGHPLAILIDQKYNEGLEIPFFGHPAMTNPIAVTLAQKYKRPLIPTRLNRIEKTQFTITVCDPIPTHHDDGTPIPIPEILQTLHTLMEGWITDNPDHWLWLHRRWKA